MRLPSFVLSGWECFAVTAKKGFGELYYKKPT
jgi:hypothetical protein